METEPTYSIQPLGDSAILIDYGNTIDEAINNRITALFHALQKSPVAGMIEAVPAYSTLAVFYDIETVLKDNTATRTAYETIREQLTSIISSLSEPEHLAHRHIQIPVCYDPRYGTDLLQVCETLQMEQEDIIKLHTANVYRVYMMGFLPGFPYMGTVDKKLTLPRKKRPVNVKAGSIGIAGDQTGIYPLNSPGGWQIIGRTPMAMFDKEKEEPVLLRAGDLISFYPITLDEFENH